MRDRILYRETLYYPLVGILEKIFIIIVGRRMLLVATPKYIILLNYHNDVTCVNTVKHAFDNQLFNCFHMLVMSYVACLD